MARTPASSASRVEVTMQALGWALAVLLVLVGLLMMRRPPRRTLRDRADNERLGVRIEQAIERLRRKG